MAIAIGLVVVLVALVAVAIAYGIYLSNLIRDGSLSSRHGTPPFDIIASSEGDGQITLRAMNGQGRAMDIRHDGVFGIISADGYGQVGGLIDSGDGEYGDGYAMREYTALTTTIGAAEAVRLDIYAYPDDPEAAHGIAFDKISYKSELGECAAWYVPGNSKTCVIFAHGRGRIRTRRFELFLRLWMPDCPSSQSTIATMMAPPRVRMAGTGSARLSGGTLKRQCSTPSTTVRMM